MIYNFKLTFNKSVELLEQLLFFSAGDTINFCYEPELQEDCLKLYGNTRIFENLSISFPSDKITLEFSIDEETYNRNFSNIQNFYNFFGGVDFKMERSGD